MQLEAKREYHRANQKSATNHNDIGYGHC